MLDLERIIHNNYTPDELEVMANRTINKYTWNPLGFYFNYDHSKAFLPLALQNADKQLFVTCKTKLNLSASASEDEETMQDLCTTPDTSTNEIRVLFIKRGWTFAQTWIEQNNYTRLSRIEMYLMIDSQHRIRVYKKENFTLIITNQNPYALEERLFSAIPLLYKEKFTWNDELIEYFRAVNTETKPEKTCEQLFQEIIKKSKILDNIKYEQLLKIVEKTSSHTLRSYQTEETKILSNIETYESTLIDLYKNLKKTQALIAFYKPDMNVKDVADYIYNNPYIVDYYSRSSSRLVVAIEAPLEYIDVPAFKQMLKNMNSYLYPKWSAPVNEYSALTKGHPIEFTTMIKDLFLSSKYKIYTRAEIVLDFERNEAKPLRRSTSDFQHRPEKWKLDTRLKQNKDRCIIPHMHIEYYDCWTGNKTNISKALNKQDIIGALDICVNTTKDINVNDSAVFGRFIRQVLIKPSEFSTGNMNSRDCYFTGIPGGEYKTIWDTEKNCFRTFLDIFINDYLNGNAEQTDFEVDFTDYTFEEE